MGNINMTFTAEDAQAVRSFMKLENRTDALKRKQKRLSNQSGKMSKKNQRGANQWAKRLGQVAMGYMGVQAAMGKAKEMLREYNQERERAAKSREESYGGFRELGQLAGGREDLQRMIAATQQTMQQTGMDRQQAGKLQFMLESAGRADQREFYAGLSTITDSLQMAESVSTIQNALGKEETGSDKAIVEKLLMASGTAKATVSEIASGATRAAQSGKGVGATDEELLASIAIGSKGEESVERVSTRVAAVAAQAEKNELLPTEEGLMGVVKAAMKLEKEGKKANEIFSEKRSLQGYRLLRDNLEKIEKLSGKIGAKGQAAGRAETTFGELAANRINLVREEFGDTIQSKQIEQQQSLVNERQRGKLEKRRQNIIKLYDTLQQQSGVNFAQRFTRRQVLKGQSTIGRTDQDLLSQIAAWDPQAARMISKRLGYSMKGEGGAVNAVMGNNAQFERTGPGEGLMVNTPNVSNELGGATIEAQLNVKDKRSPQQSRTGGAAGVE